MDNVGSPGHSTVSYGTEANSKERAVAIGKHECGNASETDLKGALEIGLDEALISLEESFYDLTDEQAASFPIEGRNNIAWIVMHCLDNLDEYGVSISTRKRVYPHEWRWDLWECAPEERPKPGDPFPGVHEMLERLRGIRGAAASAIAAASESFLVEKVGRHPRKPLRSDFYMRTIFHTMAHVRQIWLLRGALGLVDGQSWPRQHWA